MISHKYKCIFIHIAKCAGTSVESAFGVAVDVDNHDVTENDFLFGWDKKNLLWVQHATPQQLLDLNLISREQWNSYYKFIIYRNSWSRAYSDYIWMMNTYKIVDSFKNFLNKTGKFTKRLNDKENIYYVGDHLYSQIDYFFLDGERINYNCEIDFDQLEVGLLKVIDDLSLKNDFFNKKLNQTSNNKKKHYSYFYNNRKKALVEKLYKDDICFFGFKYEEKKNPFQSLWSNIRSF